MVIVIVLVALLALVASQGAPGAVLVVAAGLPPEHRPLLVRFIDRSRRFRRAGALAAVLVAAAMTVAVSAERGGGTATGPVDLRAFAAVGLGGSILGSVAAETFRLRRPRGPRIASLAVRDPDAYADPVAGRRARGLLGLSLAGGVASVVLASPAWRSLSVLGATVILLLLRRWALARIALRGRPVLPAHLEAADDRVRELASSVGLSRPIVTLTALLGSMQWAALAAGPDGDQSTLHEAFSGVAAVVSWALFGAAAVWWWHNRSFGLRTSGAGARSLRRVGWLRLAAGLGAVVLLALLVMAIRRG